MKETLRDIPQVQLRISKSHKENQCGGLEGATEAENWKCTRFMTHGNASNKGGTFAHLEVANAPSRCGYEHALLRLDARCSINSAR